MNSFALTIAAWIVFLSIASFAVHFSKRWRIPHSVFLVFIGVLLFFLTKAVPSVFSFLSVFQLSPELIFFVFLPTLIFESAFQMPLRKLLFDAVPIGVLAVFSYLLSAGIIAVGLWGVLLIFGIPVPFLMTMLFGAIISATDPVAVLAVFKKLGVTPRLTRLFEGESLFNDGTAWALFLILLEIILLKQGIFAGGDIPLMMLKFVVMVAGGVVFGMMMGALFTFLIGLSREEEVVQLTLTLIMAHATFLLADLSKHVLSFGGVHFEISAIIATVVASAILGSKGIQKFTPHVRQHMKTLWEHFAFIANSLIFVLIGMMAMDTFHLDHLSALIIPLSIAIGVTILARYISIYLPVGVYNVFLPKDSPLTIPPAWSKMLAWGSLRGAIAVAAILMIPDDIHIPGWSFEIPEKEFLTVLVISCILFTMFIKAMTLEYFVKKLNLAAFSEQEKIEELEAQLLTNDTVLSRLDSLKEKGYLSEETEERLRKAYVKSQQINKAEISRLFQEEVSPETAEKIMRLHALSVEEKVIQKLLDFGEISESVYWHLEDTIVRQRERVDHNEAQIQGGFKVPKNIRPEEVSERYQISRARIIITSKVIRRLQELQNANLSIPNDILKALLGQYKTLHSEAIHMRDFITKNYSALVKDMEYEIFSQFLSRFEALYLVNLHQKSIVEDRVFSHLSEKGVFHEAG